MTLETWMERGESPLDGGGDEGNGKGGGEEGEGRRGDVTGV